MQELLDVEIEDRDSNWDKEFLNLLPKSRFLFLSESPIEGPDGLPYLPVNIAEDGEPAEKVLDWLAEKGIGLVINPNKENPDYVFSFGMIWNFIVNGEFITETESSLSGGQDIDINPGQEMVAGTPSDSYLPPHVRNLFREFLLEQGVYSPKIIMLSQDSKHFDLCFSQESLGNPPQEEWQGILEAFSWFFPLHYSFSIISEELIQGIDFVDL